jgi:tetratricopeptide (TPR) repeat protein
MAIGAAREIEMLAGDPAAAERAGREGCELLMQLGERSWLSTQACHLADVLYALGRYEESGQWALRGLELGSTDDVVTQVYGLSVQSRLLARKGDASTALVLARKADSLARNSDSLRAQGDAALSLADVMYLTGNPSGAEKAVRRASDCYRRKGATAYVARAQRLAAAWTSGHPAVTG